MKKLRVTYNSPVILTFSFISLASLILGYITGGASTALLFTVYRSSLLDPLFYLRLFTYVLGHADFAHFIGNITLMLVIGPAMEEKYGSKPLLKCIFITALAAGLVQVIFLPNTGLLGASGIVFMLIILSSLGSFRDGEIPLTLILVTVFYIGGEILDGLFVKDNVSQLTHIVGGLCGGAFGFLSKKGRV